MVVAVPPTSVANPIGMRIPDALRPVTIAYVIVDDADAQHDRVVAAGGKITQPLTDQPYGGRDFGCLDLEGNTWHFGTYDPFAATEG